jgi:hypothetical protein
MAFGFDGGPDFFDFTGFADEEGAADASSSTQAIYSVQQLNES